MSFLGSTLQYNVHVEVWCAPKRQNGPPSPHPSSCETATPLHRRITVVIAQATTTQAAALPWRTQKRNYKANAVTRIVSDSLGVAPPGETRWHNNGELRS